jgi:3-oxoacyl-[acyl-carrier protein] reductase
LACAPSPGFASAVPRFGTTLVDEGCAVGICARDAQQLEAAAVDLRAVGGRVVAVATDVTDEGAVRRFVQTVDDAFGRIDILVNNAALLIRKEIDEYDDEDWDRTFDVNLRSQFLLCRAASRHMKTVGWGRIVNIAASNAYNGGLYQSSVYAIAKGGTLTLTRSFASRLAPFGICVNTVAPGPTNTPMFSYKLTEKDIADFHARLPMRRIAEPVDPPGHCRGSLARGPRQGRDGRDDSARPAPGDEAPGATGALSATWSGPLAGHRALRVKVECHAREAPGRAGRRQGAAQEPERACG